MVLSSIRRLQLKLNRIVEETKSRHCDIIIDDEYVILDSQLPHFILTNPYDGIIPELADRAIKLLNG